jgi:hypothetical protein
MNDSYKRLKDYWWIEDFDLDTNETAAQEVRNMYEGEVKKAKIHRDSFYC